MAQMAIVGYHKFVSTGPNRRAEIILYFNNNKTHKLSFNTGADLDFIAISQILDSNSEKYFETNNGLIFSKSAGYLKSVPFNALKEEV